MIRTSHSSRNSRLSSFPIFGRSLMGRPPDTSRSSASAHTSTSFRFTNSSMVSASVTR